MDGPITNGTLEVSEENESTGLSIRAKMETKSATKSMSSFVEMRSGFLDEINKFLISGSLESLKQKWNSYHAKDVTKRVSLEQALKDKVVAILNSPQNDTHVEDLKRFLNSVLVLCINEQITTLAFVNILSDIVDMSTLSVCESLFEFVEENLSSWKNSAFFAPGKNNILRMCNDLLRRLSKAQNTVFCGRILLFLAMFFPFSERSGLNIVSEFNSDIIYRDDKGKEEPVEIVDVSLKLDEDFHEKFWLIQEFFRNPNMCYNKSQWKEFTESIGGTDHRGSIVYALETSIANDVIGNLIFGTFKKNRLNRDAADRLSNYCKPDYFTKFLTSQKLLILQLSDSNFRRTICMQFLILFQYLTGQIKTKPENQELSESEVEWVKESTEKIYSVIKETPPDGEQFLSIAKNMIQVILSHSLGVWIGLKQDFMYLSDTGEFCFSLMLYSEGARKIFWKGQGEEIWSGWKNEGCPALKQVETAKATPQSTIQDSLGLRSFSVLAAQSATGFDSIFVPSKTGPPQATSLKHSFDDYISSLTPAPELKDFLAEAIEESERKMDPEKKKVADPSFSWLSVKLISLKAPTFFSNSHTAVPSMSEYVDIMCKKLYRDLNPGLLLPPYMPAPKSLGTKTKKPAGKGSNGTGVGLKKKTMKVPKGDGETVVKVVKGGVVKLVKTGQGIKEYKEKLSLLSVVKKKKEEMELLLKFHFSKKLGKLKQLLYGARGMNILTLETINYCQVLKESDLDSSESGSCSDKTKPTEKNDDAKSSDKINTSSSTKQTSEKSAPAKKLEKSSSDTSFSKPSAPSKPEKSRTEKKSKSPSPMASRKTEEKSKKDEKRNEKRSRERSVESRKEKDSLDKGRPAAKSPGKRKASPRRDDHKSSKSSRVEETKPKDTITRDQIHDLAKSIASNWKAVAERLGYKEDEILFFESEASSDYNRAMNLLLVWVSDEEDATKETLRRHLKSLGLSSAVSILSK